MGIPVLERGKSRTLYYSTRYDTLKALYPDDERWNDFDEETRVVVSEPLGELPGVWNEVPESKLGRRPARPGRDTSVPSARAGARLTDPLTFVRERRFYGR